MASLPLLPDSQPRLVGIARLASQGESVRQGHEVEYFTLPVRSLLNRCTGVRMPFTWTINPYRGCEFACKYCYARYTHEFMELRDGVDFERKIFVKQQAAGLLRSELKKVKRGEGIALVTKSNMVTRDAKLLRRVGERNRISVHITVTTLDTELARKLEPRAPRPDLRMEAVRQLNLAGVYTGVNCMPVLPEITDHPRDLEALVKAASEARSE